ncbi:MAG: metalloprotease [Aeropyrum sp.]|nr:metalloprotease [Aeropyrum sp.]MCE4616728.1 metalloprotease [Aeropyrum sp.]
MELLGGGGLSRRVNIELEEPVSWIAGLAAVTFAWGGLSVLNPQFYISPSFIAVLAGFVLHEAAHKIVAIRMGMKSEFVAYGPGLLVTFLSGIIPFIVVLAPGYVRSVYTGWTSPKGFFYSVVAGPSTNILLALASLFLLQASPPLELARYLSAMVEVNAWFAFFNLLPISPLDGSKILRASPTVWAAMFIVSAVLVVS